MTNFHYQITDEFIEELQTFFCVEHI